MDRLESSIACPPMTTPKTVPQRGGKGDFLPRPVSASAATTPVGVRTGQARKRTPVVRITARRWRSTLDGGSWLDNLQILMTLRSIYFASTGQLARDASAAGSPLKHHGIQHVEEPRTEHDREQSMACNRDTGPAAASPLLARTRAASSCPGPPSPLTPRSRTPPPRGWHHPITCRAAPDLT